MSKVVAEPSILFAIVLLLGAAAWVFLLVGLRWKRFRSTKEFAWLTSRGRSNETVVRVSIAFVGVFALGMACVPFSFLL